MSESTRKKVIFGLLMVAVIWGYNSLKSSPKSKPAERKAVPTATAAQNTQAPPVTPTSPKLVNIEKKAKEPWGKDPFRVERGSGAVHQLSPKEQKWLLSGILYNSQSPVAIINNTPVRAGDVINNAKVLKIDKKAVMLEYNGSKMTITVTKG